MIPELQLQLPDVTHHLTSFIAAEVAAAGLRRAVIGISGGVDSALVAFLTVKALGADNVLGVRMPYRSSSASSLTDAAAVIDALGIRHETVDISPMVDAFCATDSQLDAVRRGNIMARSRMILLYDRSAREQGLVVGTGNRTEVLLGYSTLHGDAACAIAPLALLYKTQVWALAEHLGVPPGIVSKAPSADLWEGQTDERELGFSYRRVDELLCLMLDCGLERSALEARGFEAAFIDAVVDRMERTRFKRELPRTPSPFATA